MAGWAETERISGGRKFFVDLKILWLEQVLEIRSTWYYHVVFSLLLPLTMVFGFTRMGSGLTDRISLIYIISGAAIFAVVNDGLHIMPLRIASMKQSGMLVYYASLPISKTAFVMAVMLSRVTVTLPGMLAPIVFGAYFCDLSIDFSLWVVLLVPLTALSLSAIGSIIDNLELIHVLVNALLFLLVMVAPVFIPLDALPLPLQIFGHLLPPTYAASALRAALNGMIGTAFFANVAVLVLMAVASFYLLNRYIAWRL